MGQKIPEKIMIPISVIVPNYNHERFLRERIESILNQTYPHFELLLLDDASTDNSRAILEQFRHHEKVKGIFYSDRNSGSPFSQWLAGFNRALYQWIWIAESDDSSEPDFLEKCVHQIQNHSSVSMIVTQSNWVDEFGKKIFLRRTPFETEGLKKGNIVLKDYLLYENPVKNASAVVFNRMLLDESEINKIIHYRWCCDWALWNYLCLKGDLYFIDQPLNYFIRHKNATSNELYYKGYLYKEGLPLSLRFQNKSKSGLNTRVRSFYRWTHHLLNQYLENAKEKRSRLYLFPPLYYCILMHLFLPIPALTRLVKKWTGKIKTTESSS